MTSANVCLVALAVAAGPFTIGRAAPAAAQNSQAAGLPARGTPAATDIIPCQPVDTTLKGCTLQGIVGVATGAPTTVQTPCNGSGNDTAAIQAALSAGGPVTLPSGVCVTSANLVLAYSGQIVSGQGRVNKDYAGSPGLATVIRPTSAVTHAFVVDASALGAFNYAESDGVQNLTVDMANMPDTSASVAFYQGQAFDDWYRNDSVVNFGSRKVSWSFNTGSYTSTVEYSFGGIVSFTGISTNDAATTTSLINDDFISIEANGVQNITLHSGAIQGVYTAGVTPVIYLPPGTTPYGFATNTAGVYAAVISEIQNSIGFTATGTDFENGGAPPVTCSVTGWSYGTYNDTIHGCLPIIEVVEIAPTASLTTIINATAAGMYFYDLGTNTRLIGQGTGYPSGTDIHNGQDLDFGGVHGFGSNAFGFTNLACFVNTGGCVTWILSPTGHLQLQPSTDADAVLYILTHAGNALLDCTTSGAPQCAILNGYTLSGYSDNFSTNTWSILGSTGSATFKQVTSGPVTATALITAPVAYASLPASPVAGERAYVNNASTCAKNTAPGSGGLFCAVIYNGSTWVGE